MALLWTPDFCPPGRPCTIDVKPDWSGINGFARKCAYHQAMSDSGVSDAEVFRAIMSTTREKEAARYAAKISLGLDKEYPGLPYTVAANGDILIDSSAFVGDKIKMKADVKVETDKLVKHPKASKVEVV